MLRELSYNLPGFGFAKCYVVGQAVDLLEILEELGILNKMKNTCQLGTMKYVYPGAHHTRYEYVFTQLLLISNILIADSKQFNVDFSRKSNLREYEHNDVEISGIALMQCLAILSNAAHMYDTFTSARILLELLNESKENKTCFYKIYKRNLPIEIHQQLDNIITTQNFYKLHLFNIIHILQRVHKNSAYSKLCDLYIHIVSQLIDERLIINNSTKRVFQLYKKIRKIAYLSVDMIYTPASFGVNLNRMIYSITTYVDDLFDSSSIINKSISQLEDVIHHQIYNSPICILNSTRIVQENIEEYRKNIVDISAIQNIRDLILEENEYKSLHSEDQPKIIKSLSSENTLLLSKDIDRNEIDIYSEQRILDKLSTSRIAFGIQITKNLKKAYYAFGYKYTDYYQKDIKSIISCIIDNNLYSKSDKINILRQVVRSIYKYDKYYFTFKSPDNIDLNDCIIIANGCKNTASKIISNFTKDNIKDSDVLHEILSCARVLESITYTGLVMCFVGGIIANEFKNSSQVDEIDGLIYFPTRDMSKEYAYIVEAKNFAHGENQAEKQLNATKKFISEKLNTNITKLEKCAYMSINLLKAANNNS